jgi:hypothetical protein
MAREDQYGKAELQIRFCGGAQRNFDRCAYRYTSPVEILDVSLL